MLEPYSKNNDDYAFLRAYLVKYPDRIDLVNTIISVYNLGALDPELCKILKRNVDRVLILSEVRTMNDAEDDINIPARKSEEEKLPIPQRVLSLLKASDGPVSLAVITQKLGVRPSTAMGGAANARKLLADGESIVCSSYDGMRSYEYRKA
jgi:hypothetical protein